MELSDYQLIQQYLNGDMQSFKILLGRHKKALFSFLMKICNDREMANDVFQETFIKVLNNLEKFQESGKFNSWLFSIAHNTCKDQWRKKGRLQEDDIESEYSIIPDNDDDIVNRLENAETHEWLEKSVRNLPQSLRDVLMLHVYSQMTFKEIADHLKISINTVLGRMHYAKQRLKVSWEEYARQ